jgi:hypothetical protein
MTHLHRLLTAGTIAALYCAGAAPLAGNAHSEPSEYAAVLAHASCAPWDGPAVAIDFYSSPAQCGQAKSARLRINLWRELPLKAGQKLDLSRATSAGVASFCAQENQCEAADSGTVWIEGLEPGKSISGRYELAFKKRGGLAGKFRANWCKNRQLCG